MAPGRNAPDFITFHPGYALLNSRMAGNGLAARELGRRPAGLSTPQTFRQNGGLTCFAQGAKRVGAVCAEISEENVMTITFSFTETGLVCAPW